MSSSDPRLSSRSMLRRGSSMRIMVVPYILLRKIYDETISILVHCQDRQNCQDLKGRAPGLSQRYWLVTSDQRRGEGDADVEIVAGSAGDRLPWESCQCWQSWQCSGPGGAGDARGIRE